MNNSQYTTSRRSRNEGVSELDHISHAEWVRRMNAEAKRFEKLLAANAGCVNANGEPDLLWAV